jgi:hypothetical protein
MIDWKIDCKTFLRLTGATSGEYGVHHISKKRVRSTLKDDTPLDSEGSAERLEIIESAKLIFPTTASKLVEWVDAQCGDFVLPDWFIAAVHADDLDEALDVLTKAQANFKCDAEASRLQPARTARERHIRSVQIEEAQAKLGVVRALIDACREAGPARERSDDFWSEIDAIRKELGPDAPGKDIWNALKERAGTGRSYILDVALDGLVWQSSTGEKKKLTKRAFDARLRREARHAKVTTRSR